MVQPLDQFGRRQVDEQHVIGTAENRVGHPLAHRNAGDLGNDIGQAFQMLDVECRPDVDAGGNQLFDILVALRMAAVLGVAVRQFVDDDDPRTAGERRVEIEFGKHTAAMVDIAARQYLQPFDERGGLAAPVGFHQTDDDVDAIGLQPTRPRQHRVGLADAGGCAEKNRELPLSPLPGQRQQCVRVRTAFRFAVGFRHSGSLAASLAASQASHSASPGIQSEVEF